MVNAWLDDRQVRLSALAIHRFSAIDIWCAFQPCNNNNNNALILLRSPFSAPRVQHLLRYSPFVYHPALLQFDELLGSAISLISNSVLSDDQWLQASLPIKDGGLGIRRVPSLATPAFLASAASTLPLQSRILAACNYTSDSVLQAITSLPGPLLSVFLPIPYPSSSHFTTVQVQTVFVLKLREVYPLFGIVPPFWLQRHLIAEIGFWRYQSRPAV